MKLTGLLEKQTAKVVLIKSALIYPNPAQPRSEMDPRALNELAASIKENGLLQPITVRRVEGGYQLIAGERRLRACKLAGLDSVPAIVMEVSDSRSAVLALIENLQRRDLTYFEEAAAYRALMTDLSLTQDELAKKIGKGQSTVANKLRLLRFTKEEQELMLSCGLTERHARAIVTVEDRHRRRRVIETVWQKRLNVAQTEEYIKSLTEGKKQGEKIIIIKDIRMFFNTVSKAVGLMRKAGVNAQTRQIDRENCIEYIVTIPKVTRAEPDTVLCGIFSP